MSDTHELPQRMMWYFADPMCSWCWGFTPVVRQLKQIYAEQVPIALMLGGLRPYTKEPITADLREDILHHWQNVHTLSGQEFTFAGALPEGFVYDTEPPSRAVVTVGELKPEYVFVYFESIQKAFYVDQRDVTRTDVLAELAQQLEIEEQQFLTHFESEDAVNKIKSHFARTRQAGVRGFPTIVLQNKQSYSVLTSGFQPFKDLSPQIEQWLQSP